MFLPILTGNWGTECINTFGQILNCICLTMQAENAADQMDWIDKINGVIASLLSFQMPERVKCSSMFSKFVAINFCSYLNCHNSITRRVFLLIPLNSIIARQPAAKVVHMWIAQMLITQHLRITHLEAFRPKIFYLCLEVRETWIII